MSSQFPVNNIDSLHKNHITIYTDGACKGNPGAGGWGVVMIWQGREKTLSGGTADTTNNRMELTAVITALNHLKRPMVITLYTDSVYVKDGITKWLAGWKNNNWRTANKKTVKNQDLWQELDKAVQRHQIKWYWVKGHSNNYYNDIVDKLACKEANNVI